MIIDALLDLGQLVAQWFLGLLPDLYLDCSGIAELGQYMGWVGAYADLGTWALVLSSIISVEASVWAV